MKRIRSYFSFDALELYLKQVAIALQIQRSNGSIRLLLSQRAVLNFIFWANHLRATSTVVSYFQRGLVFREIFSL